MPILSETIFNLKFEDESEKLEFYEQLTNATEKQIQETETYLNRKSTQKNFNPVKNIQSELEDIDEKDDVDLKLKQIVLALNSDISEFNNLLDTRFPIFKQEACMSQQDYRSDGGNNLPNILDDFVNDDDHVQAHQPQPQEKMNFEIAEYSNSKNLTYKGSPVDTFTNNVKIKKGTSGKLQETPNNWKEIRKEIKYDLAGYEYIQILGEDMHMSKSWGNEDYILRLVRYAVTISIWKETPFFETPILTKELLTTTEPKICETIFNRVIQWHIRNNKLAVELLVFFYHCSNACLDDHKLKYAFKNHFMSIFQKTPSSNAMDEFAMLSSVKSVVRLIENLNFSIPENDVLLTIAQ